MKYKMIWEKSKTAYNKIIKKWLKAISTLKIKIIPKEIQKEVENDIDEFNKEELDLINDFYKYIAEFKGNYIYLNIKKKNQFLKLED